MINKPLVEAIQRVLNDHFDGLNERDIRRMVLEKMGLRRLPLEIREVLRGNPNLFVGPLSDNTWRLKSVLETEEIAAGEQSGLRDARGKPIIPYLAHLPSLNSFIAFDLETTGIKADRDQIIQVSAVRIVNGEPAGTVADDGAELPAVFDEYVNLKGREIPYGLQVKLGFADHPEWLEILQQASPLENVLRSFKQWAGDLPLVAHNARFDHNFLQKSAETIDWQIKNAVVDTLELACLARPDLNSFRLEELGRVLDIGEGLEGGRQVEQWARGNGVEVFSWAGFHNAIVDVLVLAAIVPRLVTTIQQRMAERPGLAVEFYHLLPETAASLGINRATVESSREVIIRNLVNVESVPATSPARLPFEFTPETVRAWFTDMVEQKGFKRREAQFQMVEVVGRAFKDDRFMAIEAPTGTGKTFAYLVPSILWARSRGEKVAISTQTRLLQDQMNSDLQRLRETLRASLPDEFYPQVLKGMGNYICLEKTAAVYAQTDLTLLDEEERFAWLYLLSWLSTTNDGLLDELSYWALNTFPALNLLQNSLCSERGECSRDRCQKCRLCFHRLAYTRAEKADVVVMNHALLLSKEWEQIGLPFTRVVIDEAHNLEDAATDAATVEVSWETIMYLVNRLLDRRSGQGVLIRVRDKVTEAEGQRLVAVALQKRNGLETLVKDFGEQVKRYIEFNRTQIDPLYGAKLVLESDPRRANPTSWKPTQEARERLAEALQDIAQVMGRLLGWLIEHPLPAFQQETINELSYLTDKLAEEAFLLETLLQVGYDPLIKVHWLEVERATASDDAQNNQTYSGPYRWAIKQAPVRVGPYLAEQLYEGKQTIIFTSATLRTTRDIGFGFFLDRLSLIPYIRAEDAVAIPPELNYSRALFAIARYMQSDARPSEMQNFVDHVGQELGWFFRFTGGNGLGLFTARMRMVSVFHDLETILSASSIPVSCQGETGSRRALLEELKTRPGSVLLGLKSFWEGVDVPGPNLCYVVMEKLPFPMLGEPVINARTAELRTKGRHEFIDYILPLMLINFKQGFGRLIRDEQDIGAVLLLDKRVWNREYRQDLIAALPGNDTVVDLPRTVKVLDDETQLSRKAVYEAIANHMANAPAEWRIDLDRLRAILAEVPEELLTKLERLLAELQLPDVAPPDLLLTLWDKVIRGLKELFKFSDWKTSEQESAVRALLAGQDALVILPTGSGKSFTFQLPALLRNGTTLVFSPLKALMKDQVDKLIDQSLPVADRVDSAQTAEEQERVYQRMRDGSARLVYIAPERVRDPKLMAALRSAKNIVQVVVDEAHCVHMWGQSFRPDFLYISQLVEAIANVRGRRPPVAALTATATPKVRDSIARRLRLRNYVTIDRNPNRPELRLIVYNKTSSGFQIHSKRDKMRILLRILRRADRNDENSIIYVNTTREAERLARRLETMGIEARYYHGKMDDQARKDVQDMFLDNQIKVVVATKAFGMGIDKSDIRYVVHYQIPGDIESYFQEAGRAGRDNKVSYSVLLYHEDDLWIHENYFVPKSLPEPEQVDNVLDWLRRRWKQAGWSKIYVDPQEMADALGFDEDRELGIHLHLLEELGFVHRDTDVTLKGSARLLTSLANIKAQAAQIAPKSIAEAVERVIISQGITATIRGELRVVEGALAEGVEPAVLDDVFYQLALSGHLIYRSFARAFTLLPGSRVLSGAALDLDIDEISRVRAEMEINLKAMRRYAESLRVGDCLREEILNYLGATKPATRANECCSLCDVNMAVPWTEEPLGEDLSDSERYQDAKYTILKAVAWNAGLGEVKGRAPYGAWTLANILVGNDFMATKYETDPERKKARRRLIVASDYYGILDGLGGGTNTVLSIVDTLRLEGYLTDAERAWEDGKYAYPTPTEKGWQRLTEGRLFNVE